MYILKQSMFILVTDGEEVGLNKLVSPHCLSNMPYNFLGHCNALKSGGQALLGLAYGRGFTASSIVDLP